MTAMPANISTMDSPIRSPDTKSCASEPPVVAESALQAIPSTISIRPQRTPLRQGRLSHHGVKEKYQPLYQKLVLTMVLMAGLEPARQKVAGDFKSPVSAIPPHQRIKIL